MHLPRARGCRILAILITLVVFWIFYFGYLCLDEICTEDNSELVSNYKRVTQLHELKLKKSDTNHEADLRHLRIIKEHRGMGHSDASNTHVSRIKSVGNKHGVPSDIDIAKLNAADHNSLQHSISRNDLRPKLKVKAPSRHLENVDISSEDVLVFLHIQKTGGTSFGKHLVKNLDIAHPCLCRSERIRCDCYTPHSHIWLFSRFSTGWACGLHADWTELTSCVDNMLSRKEFHIHPHVKAYR